MMCSKPAVLAAVLLLAAVRSEGLASKSVIHGATNSNTESSAISFDYPQHGTMDISLVGDMGDGARVIFTPTGANRSFLRYQGYINQSALSTTESFTVTKGIAHTMLSRGGWSLNVSHAAPLVALAVGGVVVSRDVSPPTRVTGSTACDPPKWHGLPCVNDPANGKNCRSGIGMTVATDRGGCMRGARSLASSKGSGSAIDVGITNEQIFGFGQTVTPGLSAVGSTKFIATFSRTLSTGPSHAPAPSYISLGVDAATNKSLAHGFFLNTHGYSAFDLGATTSTQLGISSPDPIFDYFLFAGPTPAAVIRQFATVAGGRMSLPPKWAMGMKYDPQEDGDNETFVPKVLNQFAERGIRPDRAILEPAWQNPQYLWDTKKFPNVTKLIEEMAPTKLILWEHPILQMTSGTCADIVSDLDGTKVCVNSDGYEIHCCPHADNCTDCTASSLYAQLVAADCIAHAPLKQLQDKHGKKRFGSGVPIPKQFSDLTLPKCQKIWKDYQLGHAIASGAEGFKLDEDDVDVDVGFNDSTVFPSVSLFANMSLPVSIYQKHSFRWLNHTLKFDNRIYPFYIIRNPMSARGDTSKDVPLPLHFASILNVKNLTIVFFTNANVLIYKQGMMGYQFHNLEGYIWQRMFHEMFETLGKRTWLQSRGGYAGSQAYPTNSYSDGYTYTTYVIGVVNSGFSGLIWAPEMRHATCTSNHSAADHADFARRSQLMFLSPQAQYNAWDGHDGCTLWDYGDKGGLPCDSEYLDMFKKHYSLRAGLKEYLYSAFEKQSRTGLPLARPLVLDSPDDQNTWSIDDQFMIGDSLMFPPAGMAGPTSTTRTVYFPYTAQSWHSWFHNATSYKPGELVEIDTPIMTAPLFVKGGTPIVYKQQHEEEGDGTLELHVWMPHTTDCSNDSGDSHVQWSEIYDDDGETTRYKTHGEHWRARAGFGTVRCSKSTRSSGKTGGSISLHFETSHSGFAVSHKRVEWVVRELSDTVRRVVCSNRERTQEFSDSDTVWSHSEHQELRVVASLGHNCTIELA